MTVTTLHACDEKKLIAIDTFAKILSVAVSNGKNIYYTEENTGMKHSELVMDYIDTLIKKASLTQAEIQGVLCMSGPGSFTGLRIGYSIAKGLALSLSIPFAAIPTLDCIAYSLLPDPHSLILAVIEARKNSYFYAFFNKGNRLTQDKEGNTLQIIEEIKQIRMDYEGTTVLTGPASDLLYESFPQELKQNILTKNENKGFAHKLLHLAKEIKIFDNEISAFLFSGPEYVRDSDAEIALGKESGIIK